MNALDRIALAHDFTDASFDAAREAFFVAETFGSEVTMVHAVPEAPEHSQDFDVVAFKAEELFKELQAAHPEVRFGKSVIQAGDPARVVLGAAAELKADLTVLGSGEKTSLDRLLLGSTAERVVRESSRPVWLVRPGRPHREVRRMVCALDASDPARTALGAAAFLARTFVAELTLLSVAPSGKRAEQEQELARSASELDLHGIALKQQIREGDLVPELIAGVVEAQADLLVLGSAGRQGLARLFHANTAERVIRLAPCSILTVRPPRA